jgi:hypothetical protein
MAEKGRFHVILTPSSPPVLIGFCDLGISTELYTLPAERHLHLLQSVTSVSRPSVPTSERCQGFAVNSPTKSSSYFWYLLQEVYSFSGDWATRACTHGSRWQYCRTQPTKPPRLEGTVDPAQFQARSKDVVCAYGDDTQSIVHVWPVGVTSMPPAGLACEVEATDGLINKYRTVARGEVGLIIAGMMYVYPRGQCSNYETGIYSDALFQALGGQ